MKVQRMLGRSTKSQDRWKLAIGDRICCAIYHPSDAGAILVREEGGVELQNHFFIPIILKSHDLLEPMVLTHLNHISESWTILLVLL
jgi:hypothetical protein